MKKKYSTIDNSAILLPQNLNPHLLQASVDLVLHALTMDLTKNLRRTPNNFSKE